jgi:carbon-monoxide dehydrogenase medium subunit
VLLVHAAADVLIGRTLDDATLAALDDAAQAAARPISDKRGTVDYRTKIAGVLARRTAAIAFARAAGTVSEKVH